MWTRSHCAQAVKYLLITIYILGSLHVNLPSEIFNEHVYATFMDDYVGAQLLKFWGDKNCMWSSDYPHPNMTWPNSRAFLGRQIGDLDPEKQKRMLSQNCIDLYGLKL